MGYVFPLLKSIDEGTEYWIHPRSWKDLSGFALRDLRYFTFLPDFVPRALMPAFVAVERRLESGPLRSHSVHYLAVLEKIEGRPQSRVNHSVTPLVMNSNEKMSRFEAGT